MDHLIAMVAVGIWGAQLGAPVDLGAADLRFLRW